MKKKLKTIGGNAIDPASTTNGKWGYKPVPNKFGKTTNASIFNKEDKKNA